MERDKKNTDRNPTEDMNAAGPVGWDQRLASFIYRWRWGLAVVVLATILGAGVAGASRVAWFTSSLTKLGDTSNGSGSVQPVVFDPSLDVWFGTDDAAVETYYQIEDRFAAEDYVMVTFEEKDHELGVFSRESLATIARLTERFLTVPGVRHVRSLTYNPWIRWGAIEDESGTENGMIISDLVDQDPATLGDDEIVERMVAVLGAERVAARLGEERVRAVLGDDVDLADFIGEPLLLGTILDATGTATAIQVQVLRPRVDNDALTAVYGNDEDARGAAPNLYSVQYQRAALRGIEHFIRLEKGLAVPTLEHAELVSWVESLDEGEKKSALRLELADPTRNFMSDASGEIVRKFHEYDVVPGGYVDRTDPAALVKAPARFEPAVLSAYTFHVGGVPLFERNFEEVGMADAVYIPVMFLVIVVCLFLVFRNLTGIVTPLAVVFGSLLIMVGTSFAIGDLFNNLTMMAPNMLTAVGIADAIHLVAAWTALRTKYDDKRTLITEVVRRNALPVLLTSITTAVGFYSLMVSELEPVYMLGYTAGFGTVCAYVISMTLVPAFLSLVPHKARLTRQKAAVAGFFTAERSSRLISGIVRRRVPILAGSVALTLIACVGLLQVEINSDFRAMFPDDNRTISDFTWIEDRLGGVGDLEIVFTGVRGPGDAPALTVDEDERLSELRLRHEAATEKIAGFVTLTPADNEELVNLEKKEEEWNASRIGVSTEFLGQLDDFEARLREEMASPESPLHVVTDLNSPLDILRKVHQVQNENHASFYRVPGEEDVPIEARRASLSIDEWSDEWFLVPAQNGSSLVAQYYLQYENGARPGENLATQLSADRTHFRVQGRMEQASSAEHRAAFRKIEEIAATEFPLLGAEVPGNIAHAAVEPLSDLTVSGKTLLFARTMRMFSVGFVKSMSIALLTITVLIGLIFRSVRLALVSLLPNFLPIVVPLSAFGLFGFPLHGPAILVSSVALGVCVDDTIHFLTNYVRAKKRGMSTEESLAFVLQESGAALTITTVVLMIGFGTLLMSDFTPNFLMGALATLMIGLAWAADFVLTPAVLSFGSRKEAVLAVEPAVSIDSRKQTALAS